MALNKIQNLTYRDLITRAFFDDLGMEFGEGVDSETQGGPERYYNFLVAYIKAMPEIDVYLKKFNSKDGYFDVDHISDIIRSKMGDIKYNTNINDAVEVIPFRINYLLYQSDPDKYVS